MATLNEKMTAIGDAIREKTGGTEPLTLDAMAQEIPNVYNKGYEKGKSEGGGGGIDWSNVTDWYHFSYQNNRNSLVAQLKYEDTSNGTNFNSMLYGCTELVEVPPLDTSKGGNFNYMFYDCWQLLRIRGLDMSSWSGINRTITQMFYNCSPDEIIFNGTFKVASNITVFKDMQFLSVESLMSLFNAFSDNTGLTTYTVTIGSTNIAKLSQEQLQIAYNKNILLA